MVNTVINLPHYFVRFIKLVTVLGATHMTKKCLFYFGDKIVFGCHSAQKIKEKRIWIIREENNLYKIDLRWKRNHLKTENRKVNRLSYRFQSPTNYFEVESRLVQRRWKKNQWLLAVLLWLMSGRYRLPAVTFVCLSMRPPFKSIALT